MNQVVKQQSSSGPTAGQRGCAQVKHQWSNSSQMVKSRQSGQAAAQPYGGEVGAQVGGDAALDEPHLVKH